MSLSTAATPSSSAPAANVLAPAATDCAPAAANCAPAAADRTPAAANCAPAAADRAPAASTFTAPDLGYLVEPARRGGRLQDPIWNDVLVADGVVACKTCERIIHTAGETHVGRFCYH
ncbi:hypothetical protein PF008_g12968 [Phytophthora fragariae]|uniref:BED-type domain-containing protein n=1 Tax=Phytophthora fragariae TaxID=53985 RepID=A0A6G0RM69_9STRA|nr:hypothetical protein PF008_g12968 [Phytophthora fragariae]